MNFKNFDIDAVCQFFNYEDANEWAKVEPFIVADADKYDQVMQDEFNFTDITSDEYVAFDAGVVYALAKINKALQAAGVNLEVKQTDLGNDLGFVLVYEGETPEDFARRVL
jgi:hypothetical protein